MDSTTSCFNVPRPTSGWLVATMRMKPAFFNFRHASATPGNITNSSMESGGYGLPSTTLHSLMTPSRSRNTAFREAVEFTSELPRTFPLGLVHLQFRVRNEHVPHHGLKRFRMG